MEETIKNTVVAERSRSYETYKDSGVEWLGEIPEHWKVNKLKSFLTVHGRIGFRGYTVNDLVNKGEGAITISPSNMGDNGMIWDKVSYLSWDKFYESPEIIVEEGDLLLVKTASIGKIAYVQNLKEKATINPQILVLKNIEINKRSFYFQLSSTVIQHQLQTEKIGSTIYTISENKILNFLAIIPPLPEQTAIANFLDDKTQKIDQAIGIKEQQIALLKERKQILIHKAVTRGVRPLSEAEMKDSGVEWIGEIPEHWEVKKLKYILNDKLKYGANESGIEYDIELPRYVRITDFGADGKLSEDNKLSLSWENGRNYLLKDGDILFARSGATVGKTYQFKKSMSVENKYCYAGYLIKAEVNEEIILSDFLYLYTISELFNKWKDSIFIKATIENIGADKYSQLFVIVPPVDIQKEILFQYETDSRKIETAISLKQQEIEKLKEYKSSLINSVVTGKVRVF